MQQRKSVSLVLWSFVIVTLFELHGSSSQVESKTKNIIDVYSPPVFDIAVLRNQKPVIVFFASKQCILCERMLSKIEALAQDEYSEDLYLARADVDRFPDLMERLGVSKTPTVRAYVKGVMTEEVRGLKMLEIYDMLERAAKVGRVREAFRNKFSG
ncbi:Thioredoxin-1 [Orchesella cincta]|uniref:Thioredoxin-1 n=1 Tax=Orchesella cincta TaxID=48709 RepID=A0A1D2M8T8_ORCCI|nr:Thioredoxin-1 [Orchesella cincta]